MITVEISLDYYPGVVTSNTFEVNYLHLCERTTLTLTTDPADVTVVSGAGGSHSQILGYRSNSEADLVSDATLCGEYAEATMTTTYPGSVTMANTEPLDLIIGDPGASEDGSWTVTLEFNLVNYLTITYSQTFEIHSVLSLSV